MTLGPRPWIDHDQSPEPPVTYLVEVEYLDGTHILCARSDRIDWAKVKRYRYGGF
jgi:hypothetical protein